ncbi:MAG: CoA transferase, partial [Proteobacteria bacterium]|nr:CoA transferase [Pseudomonadota bacterium]
GEGIAVWLSIIARNKKCMTLDVRTEAGLSIVRDLIKRADIVLENFRPGTMEKWGLGYRQLSELNPGIIMTRASGYGQDGPYSSRAGYGGIGEAMGGLRHIVGDPSTPPSRVGISIGDSLAAMFACIGTLAALQSRQRSGQGQVVDAAIYESVLAIMESTIPEFTVAGLIRERSGSILPGIAPSNVYLTADDHMILIGANQDTVFKRLCKAMQQEDLSEDERYKTHHARAENQAELDDLISAWTRQFETNELLALLEEHAVPAGRIFTIPDMLEDPHYQARDSIIDIEDSEHDNLKMQNVFPRLSATPGQVNWSGPKLGQHNKEIYSELLDFSEEKLDELKQAGVI